MCFGVGKLFLLYEDVILVFLDMAGQHLQLFLLQPAECPSRLGVTGIVIGLSDMGGCSVFFSLVLTSQIFLFS